ncbi:TPA: hypothetical protein U1W10_000957 [Streptococcus suis]|nr:hypothetical protein [Streptococcus suis]
MNGKTVAKVENTGRLTAELEAKIKLVDLPIKKFFQTCGTNGIPVLL